ASGASVNGKATIMREKRSGNELEDALRQCGVTDRTLAPREKEALDRHGYIVLWDVMDGGWLARLRDTFETAVAEGHRHGAPRHLPASDAVFDGIYTQPPGLP